MRAGRETSRGHSFIKNLRVAVAAMARVRAMRRRRWPLAAGRLRVTGQRVIGQRVSGQQDKAAAACIRRSTRQASHHLRAHILTEPWAPVHIHVLKRLKDWKDSLLLPAEVFSDITARVMAAARSSTGAGDCSARGGRRRGCGEGG